MIAGMTSIMKIAKAAGLTAVLAFSAFSALSVPIVTLPGLPARGPVQASDQFPLQPSGAASLQSTTASALARFVHGVAAPQITYAQTDGLRLEIQRDSAPLDYTGTHAGFVLQHRDAEVLGAGGTPGAVFQFNYTGSGTVTAGSLNSQSIGWGLLSSTTKTGDGSGHAFTAICNVGTYGPGGYNECGGFQYTMNNTGSLLSNLSALEGLISDTTAATACSAGCPTEMHNVVARMLRNSSAAEPALNFTDNFLATSEGSQPIDAVLATLSNAGSNTWKTGIDLSTAVFSTGRAILVPNNSCIGSLTSSGGPGCVLFDSGADVTYLTNPHAIGSVCLATQSLVCQLAAGANAAQGVVIGAPVGGFQGVGTLNMQDALYLGGNVREAAGFHRVQATTYALLTTADPSPTTGDQLVISDAPACTSNVAVTTGGGTGHSCAVVYTGAAWVAMVTH